MSCFFFHQVCTKDFSRKDFLLKHKLTHTGEKPHCCSQCHKRFSQRSNLNKHMLTHTKVTICALNGFNGIGKNILTKCHRILVFLKISRKCREMLVLKNSIRRIIQNAFLRVFFYLSVPASTLFVVQIHRFTCKMCRRGFHQMINVHRHEQLHCNTNKHFQCTWCSKVQYQGADCLKTFLDKRDANTE